MGLEGGGPQGTRRPLHAAVRAASDVRPRRLSLKRKPPMAESPSVLAPSPLDEESLARAEKFTLEPFVHEGEDAAAVLAEGTARRHALDAALAEIEAGLREPSLEWRAEYPLTLGLHPPLSQAEPP